MHLLARSQGVATLASAFHDDNFVRQEVEQMCDWLRSCVQGASRNARRKHRTGRRVRRQGGRKPKRADRLPALSDR
jgi:hypothetical protein